MKRNTILVVDDDMGVRESLQAILGAHDYDVQTVASGDEGLAYCNQQPPNMLILDIHMPGMSGIGVLNKLTVKPGVLKVPTLVLTGNTRIGDTLEGSGVAGVIHKPCGVEELVAAVEGALAESRAQPAAVRNTDASNLVVVVDDNASMLADLDRQLRAEGLTMRAVEDPAEAVAICILEQPCLLILNAIMSYMNGPAVVGVLRQVPRTARIPIVMFDEDGYAAGDCRRLMRSEGGTFKYVPERRASPIVGAAKCLLTA